MKALVLDSGKLYIRDKDVPTMVGDDDVEIKIHTVGICGSDVHYYQHGRIGPFIVKDPMILGHEASGVVTAIGKNVTHLSVGDRVCMEPGIPDLSSIQSKSGFYNLDPAVRFWATPPIDGCLRESVVHPAAFTFKLPDHLSFAEGAMVEPLAIGMQSATKAQIKPGDIALVIGAGPIGVLTSLCALAGGCAEVIICDIVDEKLSVAGQYQGIHPVNSKKTDLLQFIRDFTDGAGVDVLFECSGSATAIANLTEYMAPNATAVLVGMPVAPAPIDVVSAQAKEITFKTIFRYVNMYPKTIRLLASGKIDLKPLISGVYKFPQAVEAFDRAAAGNPQDVKIIIEME